MKKTIHKYMIAALLVSIGLSSCVKKFDPASYAPPVNIGGYTNPDQIATANLVSHWNFNGTLTDSISKVTGVATGTSFSDGLKGKALQGANNGYVISDVPAAVQNLHDFTISVWVNMPLNDNGAVGLLSIANDQTGGPGFWGSLDIFFDNGGDASTGKLTVHAFNVSGSPAGSDAWEAGYSAANPWGGWTNVTVTYEDATSTFKVYYKGSLVETNVATGFGPLNWKAAKKMVFGTLQFQTTPSLTANTGAQDWASFLTGELDEVRIYNKVLSSNEVNALVALQHRGK